MDDDSPTPEELEQAAALARALERGSASESLPEDAFATAAVLRYSQDAGQLDEARQEQILRQVLAEARPQRVAGTGWLGHRLRWVWGGAAALAAAAGVFAIRVQLGRDASSERVIADEVARVLPAPPASLLGVQAQVASGHATLDQLEQSMRPYRSSVYGELRARYSR